MRTRNRFTLLFLVLVPLVGICTWMYANVSPAMSRLVTDPQFRAGWLHGELHAYAFFWLGLLLTGLGCVGLLGRFLVKGGVR